jgi:hypothetical protein
MDPTTTPTKRSIRRRTGAVVATGAFALTSLFGLAGCGDDDEGVVDDDVQDEVEDMGDEGEDLIEDTGDAIEEDTDDMTDSSEDDDGG